MAGLPDLVLSPDRKLALLVPLFVLALALVALAAATEESAPLFFAWVPLVGAGWVLARPEPPRGTGHGGTPPPSPRE